MRFLLAFAILTTTLAPARADPARPSVASLQKQRAEVAARAYASSLARFEGGAANVEDVARWSLRWLDATLDGASGKAIATALAAHTDRMIDLEEKAIAASKSGRTYASDADAATYHRIEADLWVARGHR